MQRRKHQVREPDPMIQIIKTGVPEQKKVVQIPCLTIFLILQIRLQEKESIQQHRPQQRQTDLKYTDLNITF